MPTIVCYYFRSCYEYLCNPWIPSRPVGRCRAALGRPAWHGMRLPVFSVAWGSAYWGIRWPQEAPHLNRCPGFKFSAWGELLLLGSSAADIMRRHGLAKVITQSAQEVRKPSTTQPSLVQVCRSVKMGWSKRNVTQDAQTAKSPMRLPHCCVCLEPWLQGSRVLVKFPKIDMSAFILLPLRSARASVHHGRRGRGHDSHDALGSPFRCASLRCAPGLRLSSLVLAWNSLGLWLRGGVTNVWR